MPPYASGLLIAEQPELAGLLEQLVRGKRAGALPAVDVRIDLLVDKLADGAAQLEMFFGEAHVHGTYIE